MSMWSDDKNVFRWQNFLGSTGRSQFHCFLSAHSAKPLPSFAAAVLTPFRMVHQSENTHQVNADHLLLRQRDQSAFLPSLSYLIMLPASMLSNICSTCSVAHSFIKYFHNDISIVTGIDLATRNFCIYRNYKRAKNQQNDSKPTCLMERDQKRHFAWAHKGGVRRHISLAGSFRVSPAALPSVMTIMTETLKKFLKVAPCSFSSALLL